MKIRNPRIAGDPKEEYLWYYDKGQTKNHVTIPVSQIKGVSRLSGYSWFELLNYSVLGVPPDIPLQSFNLNKIKFLNLLLLLETKDTRTVKQAYQKKDDITFHCYVKGDAKEYYGSEGNHRTITAKIYGWDVLKAQSVDYHVFNEQKYHELQLYKKQKAKIKALIAPLNLSIDNDDMIIFKFRECYKQINLSFEDLKRECDSASELNQTMNFIKESLQRVTSLVNFYRFLYQRYPQKLKKASYSYSNIVIPKKGSIVKNN